MTTVKELSNVNLRNMVTAEQCRRSLYYFAKHIWPEIDPGHEFIDEWWVKTLCEHLEACYHRKITRLAITIPPRHGKSTLVRILFPAWVWLNNPSERFLCTTYKKNLTLRDSRLLRRLIKNPKFQRIVNNLPHIPNWELSKEIRTIESWENTERGSMHSFSIGGTTGEGCDFMIIDDLMSVSMAKSEAERLNALEYYFETLPSRIDRPETGVKIIIMQRLHEWDLVGCVMNNSVEDWDLLCLPAEYESDHRWKSKTKLGFVDPRQEGEILCEIITPRFDLENKKQDMTEYDYTAQYRQDPVPKAGGILHRDWFQETTLKEQQQRKSVFTIVSYDPAYSEKHELTSSYTARITLRVYREWLTDGSGYVHKVCLMGAKKERWSFPQFEREALKHAEQTKPDLILVENKASGKSIIQSLRRKLPNVVGFEPNKYGDKVERMQVIAPLVEAENFSFIPEHKASANAVEILCRFPADNTDIPDAFSQAVIKLQEMRWLKMETDSDYVTIVNNQQARKLNAPLYG